MEENKKKLTEEEERELKEFSREYWKWMQRYRDKFGVGFPWWQSPVKGREVIDFMKECIRTGKRFVPPKSKAQY